MYILDYTQTMNEIGFYRLGFILKNAVGIISVVLPIIVIILGIMDMSKSIMKPDEMKNSLKTISQRIIAGLVVFLLPSVLSFAFELIEGYDDSSIVKYYNDASKNKLDALEAQYEAEKKAADAQTAAENKELLLKSQEEERKRNEQLEEIRSEFDVPEETPGTGGTGGTTTPGTPGNYEGDTVPGGTYGSVEVKDGVFYLPNTRPTSDAHIPKQSGQYGLNPVFWERLSALINDAAAQGYTITVTSGWRSYSSQRSLWDNSNRPCSERGKWVACPGGSRHGFGIAADLSFNGTSCSGGWDCNSAAAWAHANAANYGLKFRMSWEPWHIEPDQIVGGSFGACTATC